MKGVFSRDASSGPVILDEFCPVELDLRRQIRSTGIAGLFALPDAKNHPSFGEKIINYPRCTQDKGKINMKDACA